MSEIKAIIYTSTKDTTDNLVFENDDIIAISTNSKVINDIENPEFDIFPNSGTLTVKDKKLVIYNKALNGAFDDFQYKVEYKVDEEVFATHIINERPRYDYENKTCTFYLGNDLDNLDTLQTEVYPYPKAEKSLYVLFEFLMKKIFELTTREILDILQAKYFGTINIYTQKGTYSTYEQYFKSIGIIYPFLPSTNAREALKTILFIAQCGLCKDKDNNFQIVRLDGYADGEAFDENVYLIEPQHINKGFVPSVILNNKYDVFNINYSNTSIEKEYEQTVFREKTNTYISINTPNIIKEELQNYYSPAFITGAGHRYTKAVLYNKVAVPIQMEIETSIDKNLNYNLIKILSLVTPINENNEIKNPVVSLILNKKKQQNIGTFEISSDNKYKSFTSTVEGNAVTEQIVINNINEFSNYIDYLYSSALTGDTKYLESTVVLKNDELQNNSTIEETTTTFDCNFVIPNKIIKESIYGGFDGTTSGYATKFTNATQIIEEFEFVALEFNYLGNTEKIVFNETTKVYKAYNTSTNNYNLQKSLQLLQDTSYIIRLPANIEYDNVVNLLAGNLYNAFKGGIHTGELTVIRSDYRQKENNIITKNKLFEIGDKVMPCKDYNGTPIVTRGTEKTPVIFQVVDVETFAEGGALFQHLKLREIKELT